MDSDPSPEDLRPGRALDAKYLFLCHIAYDVLACGGPSHKSEVVIAAPKLTRLDQALLASVLRRASARIRGLKARSETLGSILFVCRFPAFLPASACACVEFCHVQEQPLPETRYSESEEPLWHIFDFKVCCKCCVSKSEAASFGSTSQELRQQGRRERGRGARGIG